ncbi:MAG: RNA polymerase sigma factor, partial [Pseudonocardiaceae bacterium]
MTPSIDRQSSSRFLRGFGIPCWAHRVDDPVEDGTELSTEHDAFVEYVLPEIDVLYRVARSLTSQPADAEDLVQDTLLRAFR